MKTQENKAQIERGKRFPHIRIYKRKKLHTSFVWWGWKTA